MTSMKLEEKKKKSLLKLNRCITMYTGLTIRKSMTGCFQRGRERWQFTIVDVSRAV
jgi:hypothetical protein